MKKGKLLEFLHGLTPVGLARAKIAKLEAKMNSRFDAIYNALYPNCKDSSNMRKIQYTRQVRERVDGKVSTYLTSKVVCDLRGSHPNSPKIILHENFKRTQGCNEFIQPTMRFATSCKDEPVCPTEFETRYGTHERLRVSTNSAAGRYASDYGRQLRQDNGTELYSSNHTRSAGIGAEGPRIEGIKSFELSALWKVIESCDSVLQTMDEIAKGHGISKATLKGDSKPAK